MLQLSFSVCSQAGVSGETNARGTFCNLSGTRDRAAITDDGARRGFLVPSVVQGHIGRGSPAMGSQDGQLTHSDPGKRPAPK